MSATGVHQTKHHTEHAEEKTDSEVRDVTSYGRLSVMLAARRGAGDSLLMCASEAQSSVSVTLVGDAAGTTTAAQASLLSIFPSISIELGASVGTSTASAKQRGGGRHLV